MDSSLLTLLMSLIVGYGLGSVPFGLLLTRFAGLGDIRTVGSGNIGATNVLRTGNKGLAAATLILDLLKGTAAVLLATWLAATYLHAAPGTADATGLTDGSVGLAGGCGAFLGHLFPVWLRFKGGKGVATYIGVLLGAVPLLAGAFCLTWLGVAVVSRLSSLAALIASLATPLIAYFIYGMGSIVFVLAVMTALLVWKHRDNIWRLRRGEESKIGATTR